MQRNRFLKLFFIEALIVGLVSAYFLIDSHDVYRWWAGKTTFTTASQECNLNTEHCEVALIDNSSLRLDIEPKPIPLMKSITFRVQIEDASLPFIEATLFATNMNMGLHTFKLFSKGDGLYEGEGMLPTCIVGNMIWQTNIVLNKPTQSIGATFFFQTGK
ncbi:MAG: hypothetical protein PHN18_06665 [Sulfurospirillaceae bacterium]|nr:hypothetical protein [Sulfurospirillaceae bacterium]MDD2827500.1 hypothetical protein [Sulfurospirillaceae bacterium]